MKTTNQIDREANEQKAKEIAEHSAYLSDFPHDKKSVMYGALEAMKWKDKERKELWRITRNHYQEWAEEQIAQEKQKLIDKLEDWLANNICNAHNFRGDDISATFMNDCIKAMKGE